MIPNCDFSKGACPRCGFVPSHASVLRNCPSFPSGLGDYVAAGLSAVGITKERVEAMVGGPCGCDERQEALNEIGHKYLGLPTGTRG